MNIYEKRSKMLSLDNSLTDKQHNLGKLCARERIERLLDKDSFREIGLFVKNKSGKFGLENKEIPYDGVITGYGKINDRKVFLACQDFRIMGGSVGRAHASKEKNTIEMAIKTGSPFIFLLDSGGARIQEGVDALSGFGDIFYSNVRASGVIPQIAVILGPCAGGAVYSPALMDFVFSVDKVSKL